MTNIQILKVDHYTNANDKGSNGKIFELACRWYTSGKKPDVIKPQGKVDAFVSWTDKKTGKRVKARFEYKSACGELPQGAYDYVAYCPEVNESINAEDQGFVFTKAEWLEFLENYNGRGKILKYNAKRDTWHIQSFYAENRPKASKPIANYIWDACYNQPTLAEFIREKRG